MQKYDLCSGQSFRGGRGNFWLKCPSSAGTRCDTSLEVAIIEIGAHGGELLLAEWYSENFIDLFVFLKQEPPGR